MQIIQRYDSASQAIFSEMLGNIILALEEPQDICGKLFEHMGFSDSWKGQFFTPDSVARMMGDIVTMDIINKVKMCEFVTVCEPTIGSGNLVIQLFNAIRAAKMNPQQVMHVTGTDVDLVAVHMAYIQLTFLHIPAVIIHGNTLTAEVFSVWPTMAHVLGMWEAKLARKHAQKSIEEVASVAIPLMEKKDFLQEIKPVQLTLF